MYCVVQLLYVIHGHLHITFVVEICTLPQSQLDGTVGKILKALKRAKVHKNTFVFFTSDNGLATVLQCYRACNCTRVFCHSVGLH